MINQKSPVLTFSALGLIHCLGTAGIPVYTASEEKPNVASYSRYSKKHTIFSPFASEAFIDELCDLGNSFDGKIALMWTHDGAGLNISNNRERLKENFLFRLPHPEMVKKILNKLLFCRLCEEYDLPAPESVEVSQLDELKKAKKRLKAPFIIKPAHTYYWYHKDFSKIIGNYQKAFIFQNFDEVEAFYKKISKINPNVVLQEYVVGDDHQLFDVNLHINQKGEIDSYAIAQKMRVYPPKAGWGCYVKTIFDEELLEICKRIIAKLELKGMMNIQFKRDERTNQPKLIEMHPRTSIFDFLGTAAGQNIPLKYYSSLTGIQIGESKQYQTDIKYINIARDLRLLIRHRKDYGLSLMEWMKSYSGVSVYDGMMLKDPRVLYHELRSAFINS
ncbi:MAG TPA: ATP-grasp domain-containing protein [Balneolaceae bacterium]